MSGNICSFFCLLMLSIFCYTRGGSNRVLFGNQVLRAEDYAPLKDTRIAILTNPTGVFYDNMESIVDVMAATEYLEVVAVFSPEHGFRGEKQAETGDQIFYVDNYTKLPVFSAYNMDVSQISKVLIDLNITSILVDMQDVGVRLYTFIWTMYNVMEAVTATTKSHEQKIKVVIADRPNPLGPLVEGPMLNMSCCVSGYGLYPIPFLHGMTIGELSLLFNSHFNMPRENLVVVKIKNWKRSEGWPIDCPWVPPSPNLPSLSSAWAYGATVFLEATTASEGRGTTTPFELFGAPFIDAKKFALKLNKDFSCSLSLLSAFRAAFYEPTFSKYNGTVVPGVQWMTDRTAVSLDGSSLPKPTAPGCSSFTPFAAGVRILCALRDLADPPESFVWDGSWFNHPGNELIDEYAGTFALREMIDSGDSAEDVVNAFENSVYLQAFKAERKKYLLYEDS